MNKQNDLEILVDYMIETSKLVFSGKLKFGSFNEAWNDGVSHIDSSSSKSISPLEENP